MFISSIYGQCDSICLIVIKFPFQHEEELIQQAREAEEKRIQEANERRIRIERGLETEEDQVDQGKRSYQYD